MTRKRKMIVTASWIYDQITRLLNLFKLKYKTKELMKSKNLAPEDIKGTIADYFPGRYYNLLRLHADIGCGI